jgi:hypothetical protein
MTFANRSALAARVHAAVDATFGERVRIDPETPSTFGVPVVDSERAPVEVVGVFMTFDDRPLALSGGGGMSFQEMLQTASIYLRVTSAEVAATEPRKDDRVTLLDRGGIYAVDRVTRPSSFRTNLYLTALRT